MEGVSALGAGAVLRRRRGGEAKGVKERYGARGGGSGAADTKKRGGEAVDGGVGL